MTHELILPNQPPEVIYIVNDRGEEIEVPREELWAHHPDAYSGEAEIYDMADLPKTEWMKKGDNDE